MRSGTFAVEPEPTGPPWRERSETGADEAAARGVYAPVRSLSYSPPDAVAVAPGDVRGTVLIPERCDGYCMGLDGRNGPNLACAQCGQPVATRVDDCGLWQVTWLDSRSVRGVPDDEPEPRVIGWDELAARDELTERDELARTPPIEPPESWNPVWEAAAGAALPHLLVGASGGPVAVPEGLLADAFRTALDALLPSGPPPKSLALAGPGLPAADADIVLVPRHPQTGRVWAVPPGSAHPVPLAAEVWTWLATDQNRTPAPPPR
ncbi:hypothetical protein [Actinomadura decatromicini]|uniref:Uncharacterized protein n=1 Tax=Actinomadura decatromicini TaxID=2604572 RepID=A0A5D3FFF0_9ACTN|nr:hypothetical protein [Actinomadura decatromicini]TYK46712.1 hypothetical protein FXF68_22945 [Actinomadura decatromicini]